MRRGAVPDTLAYLWYTFPSTGLPCPAFMYLILFSLIIQYLVDVPVNPILSWGETEGEGALQSQEPMEFHSPAELRLLALMEAC